MKLTHYGHACFLLETQGFSILFDPFISGNELARGIDIDAVSCDFILISHGHADHIADADRIIKNNPGAIVLSSFEVCQWLSARGVVHTIPMNTGGKKDLPFGSVKCVVAQHSSSMPDGSYGGHPMGFVIHSAGKTLYFAGDTALTTDMQIIPRLWGTPDVSLLPVGDHFTMGYEDACIAAEWLHCKHVVAMHYDTFEPIRVDKGIARDHFASSGISLTFLQPGESLIV